MRERLARALGDPTLDVAYRLGDGRYVDAAGRPVELPQRRRPCRHGGDRRRRRGRCARFTIRRCSTSRRSSNLFVRPLRSCSRTSASRQRCGRSSRRCAPRAGRIVAAADAERRRIERNLHDGAQQRLVTLSVALGLEASHADAATADVLSRAQDEVEQAIAELRELARGIHPTLLRDEGLTAAVEALARRAPLPVTVHEQRCETACLIPSSSPPTSSSPRRSRTSSSTPRRRQASVLLEREPATLRVTVTDDGVGGARHHARIGPGRSSRPTRGTRRDVVDRERRRAAARPSAPFFPCES